MDQERYDRLARWYKWLTWFGIFLNCLFIFPLMFAPRFALDLLHINVDPVLFARISGMLLLWISVFYIPATRDLKKYRVYAWLAMFPSRIGGASFFFGAVFIFGYPYGYLPIAIVDFTILVLQLIVMLKIRAVEHPPASILPVPPKSRRWLGLVGILLLLALIVACIGWYKLLRPVDQHFASQEEAFKYGSIGTEDAAGIPYWIWLSLPRMFPEYLPGPGGYNALGLYNEPGKGHGLPVGFSLKTIGFERVGINCAFCHSSTVRLSANEAPVLLVGGAATTVDVLGYERFLLRCAADPRFNAGNVMDEIDKMYKMGFLDRMIYHYILIPATKKALIRQAPLFAWTESRPNWGPGRIDPFNPLKFATLHVSIGDTIGNSDMEPTWNMRARQGMAYHWDGLNTELVEVVRSSAIGDGATHKSIPLESLQSLQDWLMDLQPPKYPSDRFPVNAALASAGKVIYDRDCASCHAFGGKRTGQVIPVAEVGTDPHRVQIWTKQAADAYNAYAEGYPWKFSHFRSTNGYVAVPLDAIWTRGPYLHNGSVPSLRALLDPPADRPKTFYRAYDVFDPKNVGYISQGDEAKTNGSFYDTVNVPGNSNQGHLWGTTLPAKDKEALVEYMKTL